MTKYHLGIWLYFSSNNNVIQSKPEYSERLITNEKETSKYLIHSCQIYLVYYTGLHSRKINK